MNWIRPWLAVGTLREAQDAQWLESCEVGAVLQLAVPTPHGNLPVLRVSN